MCSYCSDDKKTLYSHKNNSWSRALTPSASSTTGTGVDLRLETTSLSPLLLALTRYWSERTGQDWFIFDSLHRLYEIFNILRLDRIQLEILPTVKFTLIHCKCIWLHSWFMLFWVILWAIFALLESKQAPKTFCWFEKAELCYSRYLDGHKFLHNHRQKTQTNRNYSDNYLIICVTFLSQHAQQTASQRWEFIFLIW